jgi:hypothetical protein
MHIGAQICKNENDLSFRLMLIDNTTVKLTMLAKEHIAQKHVFLHIKSHEYKGRIRW